MMSQKTKSINRKQHIFEILSFLATFGPFLYYIIKAFILCEATAPKVALTASITGAIVLLVINSLMKFNIRSTLWVLFLGIYFCLDGIIGLIIAVAIGTILDEFIFSPLAKHYKLKKTINKEFDDRMESK